MILTADGKQTPIVMGSYGIGMERIMTSAIELFHDQDGIIWPVSIAPYTVVITPVNYKEDLKAAADNLYAELSAAGVETLLDDRTERPGVKFKDADLIGVPFRIVLGAEKLKQGKVELFTRSTRKTERGTRRIGSATQGSDRSGTSVIRGQAVRIFAKLHMARSVQPQTNYKSGGMPGYGPRPCPETWRFPFYLARGWQER